MALQETADLDARTGTEGSPGNSRVLVGILLVFGIDDSSNRRIVGLEEEGHRPRGSHNSIRQECMAGTDSKFDQDGCRLRKAHVRTTVSDFERASGKKSNWSGRFSVSLIRVCSAS